MKGRGAVGGGGGGRTWWRGNTTLVAIKVCDGGRVSFIRVSLPIPAFELIREESPCCQSYTVARLKRVYHFARGAQYSGPKAPPGSAKNATCTALSPRVFLAAPDTPTPDVRARFTFINSVRTRLPRVRRHARENNLNATILSSSYTNSFSRRLSLPPCIIT